MKSTVTEKWLTPDGSLPTGYWPQNELVRFIPEDLHEAAVAAARAEGMLEAARIVRAQIGKSPYYDGKMIAFRYGLTDGFEAAAQAIEAEASK